MNSLCSAIDTDCDKINDGWAESHTVAYNNRWFKLTLWDDKKNLGKDNRITTKKKNAYNNYNSMRKMIQPKMISYLVYLITLLFQLYNAADNKQKANKVSISENYDYTIIHK